MDAIEILRQMHVEAKSGFEKIEQASGEQRRTMWDKLHPELKMHEQLEERCVYDPVSQEVQGRDPVLADWHTRHHQEVGEAERMIGEINRLDHNDNQWMTKIQELRTTLERHIQTEEGDIWPRIKQIWGAQKLDEAGRRIDEEKRSGTARAA